jgi:outer membrane protein OmpA-like peptidoglycan-associated protein
MQGKKVVYDGKSDASGTSSFQLLPGEYKIDVSAKGYIPAEEDLDISKATKGTTQTIELKQPKIEKGLEFKLKSINFETGSDKLTNSSGDILNLMASMLKEYPQMIVEVAGYSDNVGDANKNLELSKKRAESVKAYLIGKGAKESQLKSIGYGEAKPIASNDTEEGRKQNRRVMFTVLEF